MTYPIASGKSFNMVLSHPQPDIEEGSLNSLPDTLREMREHFAGWDERLTKVISLIHTTLKWPLYSLPCLPTYIHPSSKLLILGDGAHAMLPYMSQGAAMAVEDGAALAEALDLAEDRKDVAKLLRLWNGVRVQRCCQMQEASSINGKLWHFADGPEQEARDAAMKWEVNEGRITNGCYSNASAVRRRKSPNQWSDHKTAMWCFGYDAEEEIRRCYQLQALTSSWS